MDGHSHRVTGAALKALLCAWLAVGLVIAACGDGADAPTERPAVTETPVEGEGVTAFSVRSDAFGADQPIPSRFTCDGEDVSPALSWSDVPDGTQSFALIMDDPDAPVGVFTHWVLFNLPADAQALPEGVAKAERPESGGVQGRNDFGDIGYGGPCPPPGGPHRYRFFLYALDGQLELEPGASKQQVLDAVEGQVLGEGQLAGTYER